MVARPPRLARAVPAVVTLACVLLPFASGNAHASRYVVDQGGGGDFTTLGAALVQQAIAPRDTVLLMPGSYPDSVVVPAQSSTLSFRILGAGGPTSNVVGYLSLPAAWRVRFEGLTLDRAATSQGPDGRLGFVRCSFPNGLHLEFDWEYASELVDCDFHARSSFRRAFGTARIDSLRFHGAPLTVEWGYGAFRMTNCTFEGPADTLLYVERFYGYQDLFFLTSSSFRAAKRGVVAGPGRTFELSVFRCTFTDLVDTGIWSANSWGSLSVTDSRFERCGSAVRWGDGSGWDYRAGSLETFSGFARDTILASTGDGLVVGAGGLASLEDCVVDGNGGRGAVYLLTTGEVWWDYYGWGYWMLPPSIVTVRRSSFTNNGGDGLVIAEADTIPPDGEYPFARPQVVDSCRFDGNGGAGLRMTAPLWRIAHNVSLANGGDGIALTIPDSGLPGALASNTSALNFGAGFRVESDAQHEDSLVVIQRNLSVLNAGAGFRVPNEWPGSFAFNDAWGNYLGQYAGAWGSADSNLTVDPRFCDLSGGIPGLGLQQGSPAGPRGPCGLIGARPEECPNVTAVGTAAPRLSFEVRPTVARGKVEFLPPTEGPDGRIELFDLSGRRLWDAAFGPATGPLRWLGESRLGATQPGLYWVRFTRAGDTQTRRLVWLR